MPEIRDRVTYLVQIRKYKSV